MNIDILKSILVKKKQIYFLFIFYLMQYFINFYTTRYQLLPMILMCILFYFGYRIISKKKCKPLRLIIGLVVEALVYILLLLVFLLISYLCLKSVFFVILLLLYIVFFIVIYPVLVVFSNSLWLSISKLSLDYFKILYKEVKKNYIVVSITSYINLILSAILIALMYYLMYSVFQVTLENINSFDYYEIIKYFKHKKITYLCYIFSIFSMFTISEIILKADDNYEERNSLNF